MTEEKIHELSSADEHPIIQAYSACSDLIPVYDDDGQIVPHSNLPPIAREYFQSIFARALFKNDYSGRNEIIEKTIFGDKVSKRFSSNLENLKIADSSETPSHHAQHGSVATERMHIQVDQFIGEKDVVRVNTSGKDFVFLLENLIDIKNRFQDRLADTSKIDVENLSLVETWRFETLNFVEIPKFLLSVGTNQISFQKCWFENKVIQLDMPSHVVFDDCTFQEPIKFYFREAGPVFKNCESKRGVWLSCSSIWSDNSRFFHSGLSVLGDGPLYFHADGCSFSSLTLKPKYVDCIWLTGCDFGSQVDLMDLRQARENGVKNISHQPSDNPALIIDGCYFSNGFRLDGSKFERPAYLEDLRFSPYGSAPTAYGTVMPEQSFWGNIRDWPIYRGLENGNESIESFVQKVRSYEYLRNEMGKKQSHTEELDFYRLEMLCRLNYESLPKKIPNWLFRNLSDYGMSYWLPLQYMFFSWIVFAHIYALLLGEEMSGWGNISQGMKLSASSIVGPFGMRREIFSRAEIVELEGLAHFLIGVQSIIGVALIFLISLALRNQFKIK